MTKRIASTVLLWLFLGGALWAFRTTGAIVLIALISCLTLREFYHLLGASGTAPFSGLGMAFGTLITLEPFLQARFGLPGHGLLALATVVFAVRILSEREPERRLDALSSTVFGLVYVGFLLQYLVRIVTPLAGDSLSPDARLILCLWVVAVSKFCDVGALLTGLAIGKTKMAPTISPKKTWEGLAGGLVVAMAVGAGVAWLARSVMPAGMDPLHAALKALPIAAIAVVSDLIESVIKRKAAIKDSGAAIPGIGGIFDLSDSLLLAAPVAYFILRLP